MNLEAQAIVLLYGLQKEQCKVGIVKDIYGEDPLMLVLLLKDRMKAGTEHRVNIMLELHLMLVNDYQMLKGHLLEAVL